MALSFPDILTNLDQILESLTLFFPAFFAYFVYVGLRTSDFEELKRSHVILVLFFALFFQILQDITADIPLLGHEIVFYFVLPPVLGVISDIIHRIFATKGVDFYQTKIVERSDTLALKDVGNVSRWQKTIREYTEDGLGDFTKEYYVEVDLEPVDQDVNPTRGFLNGYSEDDIELIRFDNLSEKDFTGIGFPDLDPDELTNTVEIIPRNKIQSIRIYRVKMEDFELE
ncbi:hypothetical protein SVXHr_0647 [Halorhabdus sp. SVX81]|uniref:hypothetical protein n=1 Tax=Halorhabdus sp. SVX81 TaxID=2978283 RepID=UPI0023DC002F|nr:hypothetical protein [Halorhabdus sp. SVX81]WEL16826.1 hypothetical protein SVXHr_0647 [Halorhabdus sp. SVX81]